MGLVRLLSSEPLPLPPTGQGPAIDKYVRDLHNYLQRLGTRFTAENILRTLNEEVETWVLDKNLDLWLEVKGNGQVVVSSDDWRGGYIATRDGHTWSDTPNEVVWEPPLYTDHFAGADLAGDQTIRDRTYTSGVNTAKVVFSLEGGTGRLKVTVSDFSADAGKTLKLRYFVWGSPSKRSPTHVVG